MSARDLFESALEASREIDHIRHALESMEERVALPPSPSLGGAVMGGSPRTLDARLVGYLDKSEKLRRRLERDYTLVDAAARVCYGADGMSDGLAALCPSSWWADALYLHYVDGMTWPAVGAVLGFSKCHVMRCARAALEIADANGYGATVAGEGFAEGKIA